MADSLHFFYGVTHRKRGKEAQPIPPDDKDSSSTLEAIILKNHLTPEQASVFNAIVGTAVQLVHEEHGNLPMDDSDVTGELFLQLLEHPALGTQDGAKLRNALIEALTPLAPTHSTDVIK